MRQIKFLLFSFLLISLAGNFAFSSHVAGSNISVVYTGTPNTYQVTLSLFRDCSGVSAPTNPAISLDNDCGVSGQVEVLPLILQQEISALDFSQCPDVSTCSDGTLPGMQLYQYQAIITLDPCDSWTIGYSLFARNQSVNTGGGGSYVETIINTATNATNTTPIVLWSPTNGFDPIPYGCVNTDKNYALNVVDPDGDSLVFSLVGALQGPGQPVNYNPPATATSPISGMTIDPQTGLMNFNASMAGNYVITVLIEEFDSNGNLLSSVMHDFLFVVEVCANNSPVAPNSIVNYTAVNTNAIYDPMTNTISMCIGDEFCFDVTFTDPDQDSIALESNVTDILPGATFTQTHISKDTVIGTVCWEYQAGYSGSVINIVAKDVICVPGSSTFAINLNIPPYLNVSFDDSICGIQTADLSATGAGPITWSVISGEPIVIGTNFSCNQCNTPVATPSITTTYLVEDNSVCNLTDTITVTVAQNFGGLDVKVFTPDTLICPGDCVEVDGYTEEEENIPITTSPWLFGQFTDETVPTNSVVDIPNAVAVAQMAPFTTIQPNMICEVCVDIEHPRIGDLRLDLVAPDGAVHTLANQNGGAGANYLNTCFTMTHPTGLALPSITTGLAPFPGPHLPLGNLNTALLGSPIGNSSQGLWRLRVHNLGSTGPALVDTWSIKMCKDSLRAFPSSFFAWDNNDGMPLVDTVDPVVCPQFGGQYVLSAFNADYCFVTDTININFHPLPDPGNDTTVQICLDAGTVNLFDYLGGTPIAVGTWEDVNGNPVNPIINSANILDMQPYKYTAESVNGCLDSSFLTVDLIDVDLTNTTTSMPLCFGDANGEITVIATTTGANPLTYSISSTPGQQASNVFTGLADGTYDVNAIYTLPNGDQCVKTETGVILTEPDLLEIKSFTVNGISPAVSDPDITTIVSPLELKACDYKSIPMSVISQGGNPNEAHQYEWYMDNISVGQGATFESINNVPGPGYVVLSDNNNVCPNDTAYYFLEHYDNIFPSFTSLKAEGCVELEVVFQDNSNEVAGGDNGYQDIRLSFSNGDAIPPIAKGGQGSYIFREAGQYDVTIDITSINANTTGSTRALHECKYDTTYLQYVEAYPLPDVRFIPNPAQITVYEPTTTMQNLSPQSGSFDATAFAWDFTKNAEPATSNQRNPEVNYPDGIPGRYPVSLTGSYNPIPSDPNEVCSSTVRGEVQIINDVNIFAPNIFTPDGNSFNETWGISINGIDIYEFELTIYNRYGEVVFKSFNPEGRWDGTFGNSGEIVQDGTYPWIITAKDAIDDNKYEFKGTINVVK